MRRHAELPGTRVPCCLSPSDDSNSSGASGSNHSNAFASSLVTMQPHSQQQQQMRPVDCDQAITCSSEAQRGRLLEFVERLSSTTSSIEMQMHTNKYVSAFFFCLISIIYIFYQLNNWQLVFELQTKAARMNFDLRRISPIIKCLNLSSLLEEIAHSLARKFNRQSDSWNAATLQIKSRTRNDQLFQWYYKTHKSFVNEWTRALRDESFNRSVVYGHIYDVYRPVEHSRKLFQTKNTLNTRISLRWCFMPKGI